MVMTIGAFFAAAQGLCGFCGGEGLFADGAEVDHEQAAGGEHDQRVDGAGQGEIALFEDGGGDDDGEGAVLDAGLDGDGEALWEVKSRDFGDDETRGHGDEVERDGDTSQGGEVFLEQVDVFGDEANDDDDKDD